MEPTRNTTRTKPDAFSNLIFGFLILFISSNLNVNHGQTVINGPHPSDQKPAGDATVGDLIGDAQFVLQFILWDLDL